jgi:hypothetical protein
MWDKKPRPNDLRNTTSKLKTHLYFLFSRQLTTGESTAGQLQEKPQKWLLPRLHVLFLG